jgi:sulfonate transport system substrate-binding protein
MKASTALNITKSRRYDALPIQDRAIEEQQRIAEIFFRLGLLPKRIWVEDAVWKLGLGNQGMNDAQ